MLRPRYHLDLAATNWQEPAGFPHLEVDSVHVWRFPLRATSAEYPGLEALLSPEEKMRFSRFHYERDQRQRTIARARLRQLLGRYLNQEPASLSFAVAANGKPYLIGEKQLHFNLSHAGEWALIAVNAAQEIGVDLEPENPGVEVEKIASHFFSRQEVPLILEYPEQERVAAFFRAWTRKEAIIKARGDGLALPLRDFGVSIRLEDAVAVLHTDWAEEEYREWELVSFMVAADCPGAVALRCSASPPLQAGFYSFRPEGPGSLRGAPHP